MNEDVAPQPANGQFTVESQIQSLRDTQREFAGKMARELEEIKSLTLAAANAGPAHEHEIVVPGTDTHVKVAAYIWQAMSVAAVVIGLLAAAGILDELAVGGLAIGPLMAAFQKWFLANTTTVTETSG